MSYSWIASNCLLLWCVVSRCRPVNMSSDEDKIAAAEAEMQECCTAISAELEKVHTDI